MQIPDYINLIIAIEFDGVLSIGDYEFPSVGKPNSLLFYLLKKLQEELDCKFILFTLRENNKTQGNILDRAINFCKNNGIEFDAINDNLPEIKRVFGYNPRKIYADYYIDSDTWNPTLDINIFMPDKFQNIYNNADDESFKNYCMEYFSSLEDFMLTCEEILTEYYDNGGTMENTIGDVILCIEEEEEE
jgi:hypothetical protein